MSAASLTLRFFERDLRDRFTGSFSGGLWALIQPLVLLAVYAFVFMTVFQAKVPGANAPGYVPFLVTALWPWTAFSEAIQRAATTVESNAALIGKVAMPREVLVLASVGSTFAIHLVGFVAILVVLAIFGRDVSPAGIPLAVLLYIPLFALTLGIALICASVQVFVRDLAQILPQLMMLLMFSAPVFYDRAILSPTVQHWIALHPFTFYADAFRAVLLHHGTIGMTHVAVACAVAAVALFIGHRVFRRLDPHFEDFL